jgi:hypothetical protein
MDKEKVLQAWESADAGLSIVALTRLALEQGWTSVPEGNQEELLASARRCDQAFHEARKRMFEELIEGADPREAAQRFGQQLEQIAKKFILEGIRLGELSNGRPLLEVLEELANNPCFCSDTELAEIGEEFGIVDQTNSARFEEATSRISRGIQSYRILLRFLDVLSSKRLEQPLSS